MASIRNSTCDRTVPEAEFSEAYNSKFESEFEPMQVLGRGGFGLVFEAKHKVDGNKYAVKRISFPDRNKRREKVMREVTALSKLDHKGIVRYYSAWVEVPPLGWQQTRDKQLFPTQDIESTLFSETQSNAMSTEMRFGSNQSKQIMTETQSSEDSYIAFDENATSVHVIDRNSDESLGMSTNSNVFDESKLSAQSNSRPLSVNTVLPRCYLYIQLQLCRKDTLKDWLRNNPFNRDSNTALDIFKQIVSAVDYVHLSGRMHRDLKPSNIFFSMEGNIKIGDFGSVTATAVDDGTHIAGASALTQSSSTNTKRVGTELYMSPEQMQYLRYTNKVDIFSMGIILFELLVPFKTEMERRIVLENVRKLIFPIDFIGKHSSECDLLNKLLSPNPDDRPSTVEIKDHNIFISKFKTTQVPTSNLSNNEPLISHNNNVTPRETVGPTYSGQAINFVLRCLSQLPSIEIIELMGAEEYTEMAVN
ncbi:unnamed protein product [Medioppia subpectinata]|uniref:non-specific serine/threonine protein kinase n=1 Tax=Medioppia subpectinata TaxID=1979941 RepID=A0A7R9KZV0_9ACAR|nr:unnamed protein product [Medioppia subpectinata]CAG2111787.1 unnamed protein product [Medioppia subpectinata]